MRYPPEHSEQTAKRVLDAAAREFREQGFGGVGVDALAKSAGVTSGAFYSHFRSKSGAFRAVVAQGVQRLNAAVGLFRGKYGDKWFVAFASYYLGKEHRRDVAGGCALPSLSAEVARAPDDTRKDYEAELVRVATAIAEGLPGHPGREAAWPVMAQLAGGVLLARAVKSEALAKEIAESVLKAMREPTQKQTGKQPRGK
jgi:AcrR family transcriptional regulator